MQGNAVVLVVDDEPEVIALVKASLRRWRVVSAANGWEALEMAAANPPDCVLLDVMMPGLDGFEVCRRLRSSSATSGAAIILLTARGLSTDKVQGLDAGADDFVVKPFDPRELEARVAAALRRHQDMRESSPLTGLPGNRALVREIDRRLGRRGDPFALIHADLDHFKEYNDAVGFAAGDHAIAAAGEILREIAGGRPGFFVGHVGGDDFAVICPVEAAEAFCQAVIDRLAELAPELSLSMGVATSSAHTFADHLDAASVATALKNRAKLVPRSAFVME